MPRPSIRDGNTAAAAALECIVSVEEGGKEVLSVAGNPDETVQEAHLEVVGLSCTSLPGYAVAVAAVEDATD